MNLAITKLKTYENISSTLPALDISYNISRKVARNHFLGRMIERGNFLEESN